MDAQYYSLRQLSPYRGMLHVVDVGHALAYTVDGERWGGRMRNRDGRLWPVGTWVDSNMVFDLENSAALLEAVHNRPDLPFAPADNIELWLLGKADGMPLALLQTRRAIAGIESVSECVWRPFLLEQADFQAECLRARDARASQARPVLHRDVLERQVNNAARPLPSAQWFMRQPDGSGRGLGGPRVTRSLEGRLLGRAEFPELLVDENWTEQIERELVREYHDWNAALLLTHLDLSRTTRRRLEIAACRRPEKLSEVFRLIPEFFDRPLLEIALVQARLMAATQAALGTGPA